LEPFLLKNIIDPLQIIPSISKTNIKTEVKCKVINSKENNVLFKMNSGSKDKINIDQKLEKFSNCTSESNVLQQLDEIDAITAIFTDDDIKLIRCAPLNITMPSASFSILLTIPISLDASKNGLYLILFVC
jgi:hypothetical protein